MLDELELIAPVRAVYGNTDAPGQSAARRRRSTLTIGGVRIHVSHGHEVGSPTPAKLLARYDADVIVYGHTHQQLVVDAGDALVVNPGAAARAGSICCRASRELTIADGASTVELDRPARP